MVGSWDANLVIVRWLDAVNHGDGGTTVRHTASPQATVGWCLQYDDDGITICAEYCETDHSWRDESFIPAAMITEVTEILDAERDDGRGGVSGSGASRRQKAANS